MEQMIAYMEKLKVMNDQKTVGSFVRHVRARRISQFSVYQQDSRKGQSMTCGVN